MEKRLLGKVAIVTGAGSVGHGIGNGKAAAILYAREGAQVLLVDNNLDAVKETQEQIEAEGGLSHIVHADVSKSLNCQMIIDTCVRVFYRIDILHNNVGVEIAGGLETTSEENWDLSLNINLKSVFLLCKFAIPIMLSNGGGVITNISSINAIRTLPTLSLPYAVSKAGMNALTREIAIEYASKGIRINAILPGMMGTPFVVAALTEAYGGDVDQMMRYRDSLCPTGKQGESWDIANLAVFLATPEARYITGAEIVVDGAQTCKI